MSAPFQIMLTDTGRAELRKVHARRAAEGQGDQILKALDAIEERIGTDPLSKARYRFELPGSGLPVVTAFVSPLVVHYAVDEQRRMIYIHHIRLGA